MSQAHIEIMLQIDESVNRILPNLAPGFISDEVNIQINTYLIIKPPDTMGNVNLSAFMLR